MLKITMIIVMTFFSIILTPHERASANPLAVGGALYLGGAGVYVVGALGIAAISGVAGCSSCQEDIEAHAQQTWQGSTQVVKDGLQAMVDASVGVGNALTATDANFNSWLESKLGEISSNAYGAKYGDENTGSFSNLYASSQRQLILVTSNATNKAMGMHLAVNGESASEISMGINYTAASPYFRTHYYTNASGAWVSKDTLTYLSRAEAEVMAGIAYQISTMQELKGFYAKYGMSLLIGTNAKPLNFANITSGVSATREAWQDMVDAGLVLPTDYATPTYAGQAVKYHADSDTYAGVDNVAVPRDGITFDYPTPQWRSLNDLTALGGAAAGLGAGLYIDGWTGNPTSTQTYDPATDITTTTTTTSGTTTNVTTGETVSTGATTTTTTTTGDTTGAPTVTPEGASPPVQKGKSSRWGKLVTTKFPFSLPWDLFFILSFLNADPVTPVFSVDERINKRENVEGIQIKFDIDLSFLDPYVPWFRRFIVLGFALFLILNTRKLLGGAQ